MNTLRYPSLDQDRNEIRLITIHEANKEAEIVNCRFEHVSLDDSPSYKVLSYCWGDPNVTRTIHVNRRNVQVTENLEAALHELRRPGTIRLLVDPICINQADLDKRGRQVLRMRDIYVNASETVAWLGNAADDSNLTLNLTDILSNAEVDMEDSDEALRRFYQPIGDCKY